jgi:hypothetical protein
MMAGKFIAPLLSDTVFHLTRMRHTHDPTQISGRFHRFFVSQGVDRQLEVLGQQFAQE